MSKPKRKKRKKKIPKIESLKIDISEPLWNNDLLPYIFSYLLAKELVLVRECSKNVKLMIENRVVCFEKLYYLGGRYFTLLRFKTINIYTKSSFINFLKNIRKQKCLEVFKCEQCNYKLDEIGVSNLFLLTEGVNKLKEFSLDCSLFRSVEILTRLLKSMKGLKSLKIIQLDLDKISDFHLTIEEYLHVFSFNSLTLSKCKIVGSLDFSKINVNNLTIEDGDYESFKQCLKGLTVNKFCKSLHIQYIRWFNEEWLDNVICLMKNNCFIEELGFHYVIFSNEIKGKILMKEISNRKNASSFCLNFECCDFSMKYFPIIIDFIERSKVKKLVLQRMFPLQASNKEDYNTLIDHLMNLSVKFTETKIKDCYIHWDSFSDFFDYVENFNLNIYEKHSLSKYVEMIQMYISSHKHNQDKKQQKTVE